MPFTPEQVQKVIKIAGPKIKKPCPSCGKKKTRQLLRELYVFGSRELPPEIPVEASSASLACVATVCSNCGHTEFYNVHTLQVASILEMAAPAIPKTPANS